MKHKLFIIIILQMERNQRATNRDGIHKTIVPHSQNNNAISEYFNRDIIGNKMAKLVKNL